MDRSQWVRPHHGRCEHPVYVRYGLTSTQLLCVLLYDSSTWYQRVIVEEKQTYMRLLTERQDNDMHVMACSGHMSEVGRHAQTRV